MGMLVLGSRRVYCCSTVKTGSQCCACFMTVSHGFLLLVCWAFISILPVSMFVAGQYVSHNTSMWSPPRKGSVAQEGAWYRGYQVVLNHLYAIQRAQMQSGMQQGFQYGPTSGECWNSLFLAGSFLLRRRDESDYFWLGCIYAMRHDCRRAWALHGAMCAEVLTSDDKKGAKLKDIPGTIILGCR